MPPLSTAWYAKLIGDLRKYIQNNKKAILGSLDEKVVLVYKKGLFCGLSGTKKPTSLSSDSGGLSDYALALTPIHSMDQVLLF